MHRPVYASLAIALGVLTLGACSAAGSSGSTHAALSAAAAAQHIGEKATVCGVVASAHYAENIKRQPTFVNLDQPYPHPVFTILIWGDYRDRFATPPETWHGRICTTGVISAFHGKPEMKVISPSQISH
ncbi:MAG TPA: hypothetical protein VFL63_03470 [Rhodanobacteraceae bacterium]|nr:hypothetical protein [Rhodanobacteraceae bacterium]